jgi:hypothetical protein
VLPEAGDCNKSGAQARLTEVPCIKLAYLTDAHCRTYTIARRFAIARSRQLPLTLFKNIRAVDRSGTGRRLPI